MHDIFLSYRRQDTGPYTAWLYSHLNRRFPGRVFFDIKRIDAGAKFSDEIKQEVSQCKVLIAMIGPNWVKMQTESGKRRIDISSDLVRLEVAMALARNDAIVIPVLAGVEVKAPNAKKDDLPSPLAALEKRNGFRVSFERFDEDVHHLIQALERELGEPAQHAMAGISTPETGAAELLAQAETAVRHSDWPAAARALQAASFLPKASPEVLIRLRWVQWRYRLSQISEYQTDSAEDAAWSDAADIGAAVKEAVRKFDLELDRLPAEQVCTSLIGKLHQRDQPFPDREAKRILIDLSLGGLYDLAAQVAGAFIETDQDCASVRRLLGMALIEQDRIGEAVRLLETLDSDSRFDPFENNEVRGLLGKAYQRLYARSTPIDRKRTNLEKAVQHFLDVFTLETHPALWHGVSAVSLLSRAKRDGIALADAPDPGALARVVVETVEKRDIERQADMWCFAAAAEASAVLDRRDEALRWTERYVRSDYADRLELKRMQRHLEEVWRPAADSPIVAEMLTLINARLLETRHGQVMIDPSAVRPTTDSQVQLNNVYAQESYQAIDWFRHGVSNCRSIARLERLDGSPFGTGFLMRGSDLHPSFGDGMVLLTCAYMVGSEGGLSIHDARVRFMSEPGSPTFRATNLLWSSPREELDTVILHLDRDLNGFPRFPLAENPPDVGRFAKQVYLVGHAGGRELSMSSGDLTNVHESWLGYKVLTEGGSGGSPVFNAMWELIAMHHLLRYSDGSTMAVGIRIDAIRQALRRDLK